MTTTNNGPALALSILYEANDLLNVLREHHGETDSGDREVSERMAAQWTLTTEISKRLVAAIAHLDGRAQAAPAASKSPNGAVLDASAHDAYMAAEKHASHLKKAARSLDKAQGIAETLRCALLSEEYDPAPFADDIAGSIVTMLDKSKQQMDRHRLRHIELFLAHHDRQRPAAPA